MTEKKIYFQNKNASSENSEVFFKFANEGAFLSQAHEKIENLEREASSKVAEEIEKLSDFNDFKFADFYFVKTKHPITNNGNKNIDIIGIAWKNDRGLAENNLETILGRKNLMRQPYLLRLEYDSDRCQPINNVLLIFDPTFDVSFSLMSRKLIFLVEEGKEYDADRKVVAIKGKSLRTRNQDIPDEINTIRLWLGDRWKEEARAGRIANWRSQLKGKVIKIDAIWIAKVDWSWTKENGYYELDLLLGDGYPAKLEIDKKRKVICGIGLCFTGQVLVVLSLLGLIIGVFSLVLRGKNKKKKC